MNRWNKEEVIILESLVQEYSCLKDLREDAINRLPDRSWGSIRNKIRRLDMVKKIEQGQIVLDEKSKSEAATLASMEGLSDTEKAIYKMVKKAPVPLKQICEEVQLSANSAIQMIDEMRKKGYDIKVKEQKNREYQKSVYMVELEKEPKPSSPVKYEGISQKQIKILLISDTGFGLKAYQPELVATAFEKAEQKNVDFAVHAGNITGGYSTPSIAQDFCSPDFYEQIEYANNMPPVTFKTYFVNGPKDLKHKRKKGLNAARTLASNRKNFRYSGDIEATFHVRGKKITVIHGKDRSTYAKSYMIQGMKENMQGNVFYLNKDKKNPDLLVVGGVDTFMYLPAKKTGGMEVIGLPSLHAMTSSQKTRKRRSGSTSLGYTIVTVNLDDKGNAVDFDYNWYPLTAYQMPLGWRGNGDIMSKALNESEKEIVKYLEERPQTYGEISRRLDLDKKTVKNIVRKLRRKGYRISYSNATGKLSIPFSWTNREFKPLPDKEMFDKVLKVAAFSDTHIGNRDARIDLIDQVYKIAKKENVDLVTHSGDVCDGMNAYYGHEQELVQHGADAQRKKALEVWPYSDIPTWIITGSSHEWIYKTKCGHNVVETFADQIENMEYIGGEKGLSGIKTVKGVKTKLFHPKGGVAYAKSYKPQKFINQFIEEIEETKDSVRLFLTGHLHVSFAMMYRGIASFLVPCLEEQTWYLESKGLFPYLGMWVTELSLDKDNNVTKVSPKYYSFE